MTGVFSQRGCKPDTTTCFVMMPFEDDFNAIYRLIQRCCMEQGLQCARADEDMAPGKITGKIYDMISSAGVVIADMTGRNANVFYELGLAHAISDNVVLLTQSTDDVPFDLRDFLHIRYTNTVDGAERLATDLFKVLSTILSSADLQLPLDDSRRFTEAVEPNQLPVEELDLGLAHLQAELARSTNDMQQAAVWLQKALEAAKTGSGDVAEVGNCAIEAERCNFLDLAEELYHLAVSSDPTHVNNRQSYVSFLLDHRAHDSEKVDLAGSILSELENTTEKQERTRGLKAQYLTMRQKGSGQPADLDAIIADAVGDGEFSTFGQAAPVLLILQKAKKHDEMQALVSNLRGKLDATEMSKLDRVLADAYASSGEQDLGDEAIGIYEELLRNQDIDATEDMSSSDIKHNLATLLLRRDLPETNKRACQLWTEAYIERPNDVAIRKSFARYLMRHGRQDDAVTVLAGEAIG